MKTIQIPEEWIKGLIKIGNQVNDEVPDTIPFREAFQFLMGYIENAESLLDKE
ncbi:MAG TPA: hypothetical protein VIH61_09465 [Waddliaceae bacterium]